MPISAQDRQAALPDLQGTQCCEGLEKTVTIHRDPWGIPHIKASSEADLFFAQGFATAQDRPLADGLRPPSGFGPLV